MQANMRPQKAADYLDIDVSTLYRWTKQGRITPRKLSPRVTLYAVKDLDQLKEDG